MFTRSTGSKLRPLAARVAITEINDNGHYTQIAVYRYFVSTSLENLQHRDVVGQHFGEEFGESRLARDCSEVVHQRFADALPLVLVDHSERDLRTAGLRDHVTSGADDPGPTRFLDDRNQGNVGVVIDIEEGCDILRREISFDAEETPVK